MRKINFAANAAAPEGGRCGGWVQTLSWSAGQLKIVQEAIALIVSGFFMVWFRGEPLHRRHVAAFACIMAGVAFLFVGR